MRKHYADTRHGQIHYVEAGSGPVVLLLHQTPRSWDEYRDVIPLLADRFRVIAPDTLGFGSSDVPPQAWSVELFADGVEDLLDALAIDRAALVGHHTGGVVGLEVAARRPGATSALVLSGVPYVDAPRRAKVATRPPIDGVPISDDGSHYALLWDRRAAFYPADRPDLRHRLMVDAVRLGERVEEGHVAVNAYRMEDRIGDVAAPTLVVCGELDEFSLPDVPLLLERLRVAESATLPGVGVPSVDHDPTTFAKVVGEFLDRTAGA
ncbi:alpha/beta fold hydrolase [Nocardioides nitrophenolicus]|uniref:alpha/beta fold hydrolase n=1 Tax=Nocardioides nitrophenolicus TaxID=60489 RepID=UPI00195EC6B6|nr:alpha/beta fold hydrolase [Nocardioides nitrophenolicus]MBM7517076.1 pimeloyl-ACP methyl ester carboxylesterase [Nocardioides nitrophenolicus]